MDAGSCKKLKYANAQLNHRGFELKRLNIYVPDNLYKRMFEQIFKLEAGSTYGRAREFVIYALELLCERLEKGDQEVKEELKRRFANIRRA